MALQYISDDSGNHTAVVIPIAEWNDITAKHVDLKELTADAKKETDKKKPSDYKGILTKEEALKLHEHLKEIRNEWDRGF